jgi:tetratricopeptide (TPR) repeat protein
LLEFRSADMTSLFEKNIFRSDDLAIDFFSLGDSPHKSIAFTFTAFTPSTKGDKDTLVGVGFGGELLLRNGFDVVAFKSAKNLWYQNILAETIKQIESFISASSISYIKRVSYGSSMGGYAAIQFSRALKIDIVLALSPQFEIDQPYDQRWQSLAQQIEFQYRIDANAISDSCKYFVAYDPKNEDVLHVQKLSALIDKHRLIEIRTPYSGHPSTTYLFETGLIQNIALSVLQHTTFDHLSILSNRKNSKTYLYELSKRLTLKNKNKSALIAINRAIIIDGAALALLIHKIIILEKLGDPVTARKLAYETCEQFTGDNIVDAHLLASLSNVLISYQDFPGALILIEKAIEIDETVMEFHLHRQSVQKLLKKSKLQGLLKKLKFGAQ